jgi:hypothetical protein
MKYKILLAATLFVGFVCQCKAADSLQDIINKGKNSLFLNDSLVSSYLGKDSKYKYDEALEVKTYSLGDYELGVDTIKSQSVFFKYFFNDDKSFKNYVRYFNSDSVYEILVDNGALLIWKNSGDIYFVLERVKKSNSLTIISQGQFLKYYAKYME